MGHSAPFDLRNSRPLACDRPQAPPNKLLGLELMRFGAALAVLLNHYRFFGRMAGMPELERSTMPFHSVLWPLYDYGYYGVELFWGISGYIFFWKYGSAIRSGVVSFREFFWLRFSRLYPLHLATLLIVVGLQAVYRQLAGGDFIYPAQDGGLFLRHLLFVSDWASVPQSFNGPIWSVSAEIAVYGAFFLLVSRFGPSLALCSFAILAGVALPMIGLEWTSIFCATYFFAGGMAALAPARAKRLAGPTLLGLLIVFAASGILRDEEKMPIILLITVPCVLVLLARVSLFDRWQQPIQGAGNLTYSSYLLHFPLQLLLAIGVAASGIVLPLTSPLFLAAYMTVTLTLAALSYRSFELPAQAWLRRLTLNRLAVA